MGSTDAFGIDDLRAIDALRRRLADEFSLPYLPHLHADAVIGWAWSVFNDYDFLAKPAGLSRPHGAGAGRGAARHSCTCRWPIRSASIFTRPATRPTSRRWCWCATRRDFESIARSRETMPYLYQSGEHHPGMYTLETTRSAIGPMAALANLLLFGKEGYRTLLGHAVEMAEVLRELIESHPNLTVLNGDNVGPVTLFRAYPDGVDTFSVKELRAQRPELSRAIAGAQRIQPPDLRARARRGPGRARAWRSR